MDLSLQLQNIAQLKKSSGPDYVGTFDGTNDYVACGAPLIPASADFDLSFDVYFDSIGSDRFLMGFYDGANEGSAGAFYISYRTGSFRVNILGNLMNSIVPVATSWMTIRIVRSGTTITLYKDGVQEQQLTGQSGTFSQGVNFVLGTINQDTGLGSTYLQGRMNNFKINGVVQYLFNEGVGATLGDSIGNNDGTIINAVTTEGAGFWANQR